MDFSRNHDGSLNLTFVDPDDLHRIVEALSAVSRDDADDCACGRLAVELYVGAALAPPAPFEAASR